jgi:hypothetical protein
MDANIGH